MIKTQYFQILMKIFTNFTFLAWVKFQKLIIKVTTTTKKGYHFSDLGYHFILYSEPIIVISDICIYSITNQSINPESGGDSDVQLLIIAIKTI